MAMTKAQIGNGSGYLYVTEVDGTTIVANIENNTDAWQNIMNYAAASASLSDPTLSVDSTFGFRFFGSTTGTAGSLAGTTELTRWIVNRGLQASLPKTAATIASGVIEVARAGSIWVIPVSNQGAAGTDDLDTITITDVVDNDLLIITGADPAQIATLKHGTGNIFLSNNTDFSTGSRQTSIVLKYSSAATAGWYEVMRSNTLPTVANLRASSVPEPIAGTELTTIVAGGGTITLEPGVSKGWQVFSGNPTLLANVIIEIDATPTTPYLDGEVIVADYRATPTVGAFSVTIFGVALTATQAAEGRVIVVAKYKLSNTTWYVSLFYRAHGVDITNKAYVDATFEDALGNPAADGMVLASTTAGVRSWQSNDAGTSVLYNTTANNATAADTTKTTLKTYTLPADTLGVDGDLLIIRAIFQTAANANGKTVGIDFGATTVATATFDANNDTFEVIAVINRVGQNNQSALGKALQWDTATGAAVGNYGIYTTPAENFAADIVINIFGTNGVAAASDIISRQASVEVYKKRN